MDEGLADMAAFLNGFDMTGSHLTYQQVFHRETSLTRLGGGLENYGASFSYFLYLWEQAGGNGDGTLEPDLEYDGTAGDLLVKLIFAEQADGMEGVQNAIDDFNAQTGADLASAADLFKDWAVAMYLDYEDSPLWDLENFDLGPASGGWTIDIVNDLFWDDRGSYRGAAGGKVGPAEESSGRRGAAVRRVVREDAQPGAGGVHRLRGWGRHADRPTYR